MSAASSANRALSLYRAFLREARKLPSAGGASRREYVQRKARAEFEGARGLAGDDQAFAFALGDVQLDNLRSQQRMLNQLAAEGNLKT